MATIEERFWAKVDKSGPIPERRPELGPCWVWTACIDPRGYGRLMVNRRSTRVHRLSLQLAGRPPVPGLDVDHLCSNRACVNPAHLEAVTHAENVSRGGLAASNARRGAERTHCKRGHLFDEANTTRNSSTGRRACRACINDSQRARFHARKKAA